MKWAFWIAAGVIAYAYVGYPAWLWLRARWCGRPVQRGMHAPFISIVLIVRNEALVIGDKLRNLLDLNYPGSSYEIIVGSDGSTDQTNAILQQFSADSRLRLLLRSQARGKAACLNDAVALAHGEIVVFTDARQRIEPEAVHLLSENFCDPTVGCVSGELMLGDSQHEDSAGGLGMYWKLEKRIREWESASGSVVGATGALYAVRRNLLSPLPPETVLDDLYIPMNVVRQGFRVVFDSRARAWDVANQGPEREFARKVRTLSGNYQSIQLSPWLLSRKNPIRFEFVSHKLTRLVVPFALAITLLAPLVLREPMYRLALMLQLAFYAIGGLAVLPFERGPIARAADAILTFVMLNVAAAVALGKFLAGRKAVWG